ncbi:uncharacterized protein E0L32_002910 [Thyridium curvatum]|uniref:Glutamate carboxypeptidase n=1 Tax=Thyridium curvatum TaxID=1093900 RepID=A0A507BK54_9PEZI|nr:uncharacterized protein E0L32_002910 [Thyridium curvatum]TPX17809.1 hypothetical protein E0L32_002910 [Thyridium curvatum]
MAPSDDQRYDPVPPIPTYDEAVATGSASRPAFEADVLSPMAEGYVPDHEGRSLLHGAHRRTGSSANARNTNGYRAPTVETDDEDSTWTSDSDDDDDLEAAHVRREMQEFDIIEPGDGRRGASSIFGKRIGFSLSLPQWKWNWRWKMPRFRIRLPNSSSAGATAGSSSTGGAEGEGTTGTARRRWALPPSFAAAFNKTAVIIVVARVVAICLVMGLLYLLFMSDLFTSMSRRLGSQMFDPESVRLHVQGSVDPERMRDMLQQFTLHTHVAGTEGDYALAVDVRNLFARFGLEDIRVDEYYVYMNYPRKDGRAVEIIGDDDKPVWQARIDEDPRGNSQATAPSLAFHGHSKSGDVRGPLIYANYGTREDFKKLQDSGIDTKGAIALVRYYGPQSDRGLKVKAAEMAGFAGCLIYSDPADDGYLKGDVAPNGRYMPADGVQRGSVALSSFVIGDPLTPNWESEKGMPRMQPHESKGLVQIPSLPLAWRDAQVLLQRLKGKGKPVFDGWAGGVPDVGEWWTGDQTSPVVRLQNEQDENDKQPIWNVYGRIEGAEQGSKSIIVGSHRDAWAYGGVDPGTGNMVFLETVRVFGDLLAKGWRPKRTIEFMSWDAEEYNMVGSTEYVEKNLEALRQDAFAYINLDTAVTGGVFRASGSPVFQKLLLSILKRVGDPHVNQTLRELWDAGGRRIEGLAADSDYVAFQDMAGTSSLDLRFEGPEPPGSGGGSYPAHSAYDGFDWVDRVGDPGFVYHAMLAQVLSLLVLELADRPVLPFDMAAYANALQKWTADLAGFLDGKVHPGPADPPFDLSRLSAAANAVTDAVREFQEWEGTWEARVLQANGWEPMGLGGQRLEYNDRMSRFEADLLDVDVNGGIPNRTQFKHVVMGPDLWNAYQDAYFPAIRDVVEAGDWVLANQTLDKVARIISKAAANLVM